LRHKRSAESILRRQIRGLIFQHSFQDSLRAETVCKLSPDDILAKLAGPIPVQVCDVPDVMKGEVLVDSRGQGSFQRWKKDGGSVFWAVERLVKRR
jgi:hypothetical protein